MLFTLGLDSMFGTLEGALTSINDMMLFPKLRKEILCGLYAIQHSYVTVNVNYVYSNFEKKNPKMAAFPKGSKDLQRINY